MRSGHFIIRLLIVNFVIIASLNVECDAQTSKSSVSGGIPTVAVQGFDAKQLKWRTDLVGSKNAQQLQLTVDFGGIDRLYDVQRLTVLVEFFREGRSIGTQSFELATGQMQAVKERKKIKHDFPLSKKYQGPDITIKGIQITAPAFSDYRYVYQESNPTPVPIV